MENYANKYSISNSFITSKQLLLGAVHCEASVMEVGHGKNIISNILNGHNETKIAGLKNLKLPYFKVRGLTFC
jgi:hypothetical protein